MWLVTTVIRNVYWHPLSPFPGPRLYATSRIPYVFSAMTGNLAVKLQELHDVYGPIVRTASNELSFIEPSAWKTIYGRSEFGYTPYKKNYDTFNETRNQIGHSIFIADDDDHVRMRKLLNYAFSPQYLRQQEPLMHENVEALLQGLERERSKSTGIVDLIQWYNWAAFDNIADASFGESFKCLRESTNRQWPILLSKTWKVITYVSGLKNTVPSLEMLRCIVPTSILQKEVNKLDMVQDRVKEHIDTGRTEGEDMLSSILKLNDEKQTMSETEIISNASLFVFAGTETVATLLPAVTYFLTHNAQVMQKLTGEIRSAFSNEESMTISDLSQLSYLTACIDEALRIFPPIPEGLPRVAPPEGDIISGQWVPGGVCR